MFGRERECALMSVNENGNGAVSTFDKNGHGFSLKIAVQRTITNLVK